MATMKIPMRVIKTIRLKCGRLVYPRGKVLMLDPHKPWVKKWIEEGHLETDLHKHRTSIRDGK